MLLFFLVWIAFVLYRLLSGEDVLSVWAEAPIVQRIVIDLVGTKDAKEAGDHIGGIDSRSRKAKSGVSGLVAQFKRFAVATGIVGALLVVMNKLQAAVGNATRELIGFRAGMAEVSTLVDTTKVDMAELSRETLKLANRRPVQQGLLSKSLYQTISAGVTDASDALDVLDVASRAAVAGVTDIETSVDGLTSALNGFNRDASEAEDTADAFFVAVQRGKTTFSEISGNIGDVASMANELGVSLEEVLSAMAAITLTGQSTSVAITQIGAILTAAQRNAEMFAAIGIDIERSLRERGLAATLADIKERAEAADIPLVKLFGRVEGAKATLTLTGTQAESFNSILQDMENRAGATDTAYAKMAKNIGSVTQVLGNRFRSFLFDRIAPGLDAVTSVLQEIELATRDLSGVADRVGELQSELTSLTQAQAAVDTFERLRDKQRLTKDETRQLEEATQMLETRFGYLVRETNSAGEAIDFYTDRIRDALDAEEAMNRGELRDTLRNLVSEFEELERRQRVGKNIMEDLNRVIPEQRKEYERLSRGQAFLASSTVDLGRELRGNENRLITTGQRLRETDILLRQAVEDVEDLFNVQGQFNMDQFVEALVVAGFRLDDAERKAQAFMDRLVEMGRLDIRQGPPVPPGFEFLNHPPPADDQSDADPVPSLEDQIEALEAKRDALVSVGDATQELADTNASLFALQRQQDTLKNHGLPDPARVKDLADETERLRDTMKDIVRASMLAATGTQDQRRALSDVLDIIRDIEELEKLAADAGDDFSVTLDGQVHTLQEQKELLEDRLEKARETLKRETQLAAAIERAKGSVEALAARPLDFGTLLLDDDQAGHLRRITSAVEEYDRALTDLANRKSLGELTEEAFEREAEALSERFLDRLRDMLSTWKFLGIVTPGVAKAFEQAFSKIEKKADAADKKTRSVADRLLDMADAVRGLRDLLSVFGELSEEADLLLGGIEGIIGNAASLQNAISTGSGFLSMVAPGLGIATNVVGVISTLIGSNDKQREEMRRLRYTLRDNVDAIRDQIQATFEGGQVGEAISQTDIDTVKALFEQLFGSGFSREDRVRIFGQIGDIIPGLSGIDDIWQQIRELIANADAGAETTAEFWLEAAGMDIGQLINRLFSGDLSARSLLESLGVDLSGIDIPNITDFLDNLSAALGSFTNDVEGTIQKIQFLTTFAGIEGTDALRAFVDMLLSSAEELPQGLREILEEASKLDLSTTEGRERLNELIQQVAAAMAAGGFDFGGLTSDQFERILEQLQAFASGGPVVSEDGDSRVSQVQRVISTTQANAVVANLETIAYYLGRLVSMVQTLVGALGGSGERAVAPGGAIVPGGDVPFPLVNIRQPVPSRSVIRANFGDIIVQRPLVDDDPDVARILGRAVELHVRESGFDTRV